MAWTVLGQRERVPSADLMDLIRGGRLGGLLWFRESLGDSVMEASERVASVRRIWPEGIPCIFAADEEGGLIQQLSGLVDEDGSTWHRLPSARALGRYGDPGAARLHGREVGRRLLRLGLDTTLAPVLDLDPGGKSGVIGTRSFGADPLAVGRIGLAWLQGLASAGARGCVKHYPGHGGTVADSHLALARLPGEPKASRHRAPFVAVADGWAHPGGPAPSIMTGHLVAAGLQIPATFDSGAIASIPRGYGPVWTDSLDMGALDRYGDLATRGRLAIDAGADLLVVASDIAAGHPLARSFAPGTSPRLRAWLRPHLPSPRLPEPLPLSASVDVAARALRHWGARSLPPGDWDWILPAGFGAYGVVPEPVVPDGARFAGRILRYDASDPASLAECLGAESSRPTLLGWLQRDADAAAYEALGLPARVRAVVFLLEVPAMETESHRWSAETTGFGEPELLALARIWAEMPATD